MLGPGKAFESWVVSACGLSVATAYRWIQAAEGFKGLRLDKRPDLLDEVDVADMLSVSFPQALRSRILKRIDALDKAEADAGEAKKLVEAETRKLAKVEAEAVEAEAVLKDAQAKADRIRAKADETLKPAMDHAKGVSSKVQDIRARLAEAKGKVSSILDAARGKVQQAQVQAQAARQAVTQAQAKVTETQTKADEAKAEVKVTVEGAKAEAKGKRNGRGKAEADTKSQAWDVFIRGWMNTLESKIRDTFPPEKQAEALQAVGNMVLALSQNYKARAKAA